MDAGLAHFWAEADAVTRGAALVLLTFSLLSWAAILRRLAAARRRGPAVSALTQYWGAASADEALPLLAGIDRSGHFLALGQAAARAQAALADEPAALPAGAIDAVISRELRAALADCGARLDAGMTLLASVGSTAPFVGLFGTVWGVYRALSGLSAGGALTIDRIAGPVGEALVMTAFGLAVAIPAVLAYNAFARINRGLLEGLDGFAADLRLRALSRASAD
ncbi:MotA/TolQ/ExbB proton channel family protein [Derxia lacustris]|uniref:MotA/TolQ/ExbB proton channel family protein n=1 Tax=Derxia lacustris TaxID=764842 RepID=UPI001F3F4711|nr:MotA/TolQ/ExbB proton channel family protein [Derxia lacustris]